MAMVEAFRKGPSKALSLLRGLGDARLSLY